MTVKPFREEHVARHLTGDRRVHLAHLVLDERMSGLPHHGLASCLFDGGGKRLRALHVEDDRLTGARGTEHGARVEDENSVSPPESTVAVDGGDAIGVAIERDANLRTIFF